MLQNLLIPALLLSVGCATTKVSTLSVYDRDSWPHWIDEDNDCQNLRAEILIDTSLIPVTLDSKGCVVVEGRWFDSYTSRMYTKAVELDIDHVVPLKHAHDHGAGDWSREQKQEFANDIYNLIAVERGENRRKSASGPNEWMPPAEEYGCEYLQRWVGIKHKYGLWFDRDENGWIKWYWKNFCSPDKVKVLGGMSPSVYGVVLNIKDFP